MVVSVIRKSLFLFMTLFMFHMFRKGLSFISTTFFSNILAHSKVLYINQSYTVCKALKVQPVELLS